MNGVKRMKSIQISKESDKILSQALKCKIELSMKKKRRYAQDLIDEVQGSKIVWK